MGGSSPRRKAAKPNAKNNGKVLGFVPPPQVVQAPMAMAA
jgi:hypothetical protein